MLLNLKFHWSWNAVLPSRNSDQVISKSDFYQTVFLPKIRPKADPNSPFWGQNQISSKNLFLTLSKSNFIWKYSIFKVIAPLDNSKKKWEKIECEYYRIVMHISPWEKVERKIALCKKRQNTISHHYRGREDCIICDETGTL